MDFQNQHYFNNSKQNKEDFFIVTWEYYDPLVHYKLVPLHFLILSHRKRMELFSDLKKFIIKSRLIKM